MTRLWTWLLVPVFLLAVAPCRAADEPRFRIVPQAGERVGGSLEDSVTGETDDLESAASFGLALEWRVSGDDRWGQLWYSQQDTQVSTAYGRYDLKVEYLHIGGTVPLGDAGKVRSYFSAGIGATHFSPTGSGVRDSNELSGSIGVGVNLPLSPRLALRAEARGYATLVDPDTALFCRVDNGDGACRIVASGRMLLQADFLVGIAFGF